MRPILFAFLCFGVFVGVPQARAEQRIPVLIDTDLGTDVDDAFALGLAFASHELDVRGVTTSGDDPDKRAMMVCRWLTVTGRRQTPVAAGQAPQPERPITDQYKYYYHPDVLFDRTKKPEKQTAVEFLASRLAAQPRKVTVVALGPLTNVARLLATRPDCKPQIARVIAVESNFSLDAPAAEKVLAAGVPVTLVTAARADAVGLTAEQARDVFRPGTPLTRQMQTLYQMWARESPSLDEAVAVALAFDKSFAETIALPASSNVTTIADLEGKRFPEWYVERIGSLRAPADRPSRFVPQGGMPVRVHVAEDFDDDIERFWWMSGKPESKLLPPGSLRACRSVLTHDFDDLLMGSREMYSAVIFNPVPGPPVGPKTRLSFRYRLHGTDTLRVQIYSLSNGYHRQLVVDDLPQDRWEHATVDMTQARRPDGTGGPLGEGERIDDIQFYVDPDAEVTIDDVVLYDAAADGETRPFPKRILFTGTFDTGQQGKHWPGAFQIVPDDGACFKAAQSVPNEKAGAPELRIGLRGERRLGERTHLAFRCKLTGADRFAVRLANSKSARKETVATPVLRQDEWSATTVEFATAGLPTVDEIQFDLPPGASLLVDDLLLFQP